MDVEITRQLVVLLDNVAAKKPKLAKENYENILKAIEENEKNKSTFLSEVASVGSLLINREDFLRLLFRLGEIAEYCEAMGFRLIGPGEHEIVLCGVECCTHRRDERLLFYVSAEEMVRADKQLPG